MTEPVSTLNIFEIANQKIPLSECQIVVDELGAGKVYIAPLGQIFVMRGLFDVESDQNRADFMEPPKQSFQRFVDEYREELDEIVKIQGINIEDATEQFISEINIGIWWPGDFPASEFVGRKLKVSSYAEDGDKPEILISLIGETDAFADVERFVPIYGSMNEEPEDAPNFVLKKTTEIYWQRSIAVATLDECSVELIPFEEPKPELWLPDPTT